MRHCETCGKPECTKIDKWRVPNYFWCEEYPKIFCTPKCYGQYLDKIGYKI